jgi:uncharacterized protein YkwD
MIKPMMWNNYAGKAALKLAHDINSSQSIKHIASDGSTPEDRIKAFGFPFYGGAENISVGIKNPFEVVLSLIIDDGIKKRGHRANVLNPAHRCGGVAKAHHKKKGDIFILTYAFYISSLKKGDVINK